MKRREFLIGGASAATVTAISGCRRGGAWVERYAVGEFLVTRENGTLRVSHSRSPGRILWESAPGGNFLSAEIGHSEIRAFGTPEGAFEIKDTVLEQYEHPSIDSIQNTGGRLTISGQLLGRGRIRYRLVFAAMSPSHLRFRVSCEGEGAEAINRIRLRPAAEAGEAFFGFGQQLTYFNQKGKVLPILVQEHGVGRGRFVVTQLVDRFANGGGGNPYVTEAPAPHYISSQCRSMLLENTEYSVFDLRPPRHLDIKVHSNVMSGRILYGETPLDLIEAYTEYSGRMRELPDWIHSGAIISVQGGTKEARKKLDQLNAAKVPLAGLWIQDWVGQRTTSAGKQLWWDWRLDEEHYPEWGRLVERLNRQGARMMIYINPFLGNEPGHNALFTEGQRRGYLVKRADGSPYLIKNTDFRAGLVDLSNPEARTWMKQIIQSELIGKAGAHGWMADFGEALPFDSTLSGGADPAVWHNRYSEQWAQVNREAVDEAEHGSEITFFNRSGFSQSPGFSTLFWLGDQLQTWDEYDGIKTAVVGLLSGGISGFSLLHSDIGGYGALSVRAAGKKIPVIARSSELLMRWMELNAFTSVFRTHEGLDPAISAQIDENKETWAHLGRFARIYKGLAAYRKRVVTEASRRGYPVVRHPFLHYPQDANTHGLRYQFMLGPDMMIAPVLEQGATAVNVYFPVGSQWVDLWTGKEVGQPGKWIKMPAPMGQPAAFLRKGGGLVGEIVSGLRGVGIQVAGACA